MSGYGRDRRYLFRREAAGYAHRQRKRRAVEREVYRAESAAEVSLAKIVAPENLLLAYDKLQRDGGHAPGIDGLTYHDLSRTEIAGVLRQVSKAITRRQYRPYPARLVSIPKGNGRHRELRLATIADRTAAKALQEAITPVLDRLFLPGSMGFRPGRGVWDVLLGIERTAIQEDRWVIAQDDIRDAFPSVRIADALADYRRHIPDPGVQYLVEAVLRGHEGQARTTGLDQGSAVGPITLNVRLHYALDLPLSAAGPGTPPWYRYADNLLYLCRSVSEGHRTLQHAQQLLQPAGFALKRDAGPPVNLLRQGAQAELLGYCMRAGEDRLWYRLGRKAWQDLALLLERAHEDEGRDPVEAAREAARGWMAALGPAFEREVEGTVLHRVRQAASRMGFRELGREAGLVGQLREARSRWVRARERALRACWTYRASRGSCGRLVGEQSVVAAACSARRDRPSAVVAGEAGRPGDGPQGGTAGLTREHRRALDEQDGHPADHIPESEGEQ